MVNMFVNRNLHAHLLLHCCLLALGILALECCFLQCFSAKVPCGDIICRLIWLVLPICFADIASCCEQSLSQMEPRPKYMFSPVG